METNWISLFDGSNLDGWTHVDKGSIILTDGILKTIGGMGLLYYHKQDFENIILRVIYKNPGGANSGVFVRIPEPPTEAWMPVNKGYEVQIYESDEPYHSTGCIYSLSKQLARPANPEEWNEMQITLTSDITEVHINGVLVTRLKEGDTVPEKKIWYEPDRGPRPTRGYIGLQNHGEDDTVFFKEVSYKKIDRES